MRIIVGQCPFKNQNDCLQIKNQRSFDRNTPFLRQLLDKTGILATFKKYDSPPSLENCLSFNNLMIINYKDIIALHWPTDEMQEIRASVITLEAECKAHITYFINQIVTNIDDLSKITDIVTIKEICTQYEGNNKYPTSAIWENYKDIPEYDQLPTLKINPDDCKSIKIINSVYDKIQKLLPKDSSIDSAIHKENCLKIGKELEPLLNLNPMYESDSTYIKIYNELLLCNSYLIDCSSIGEYEIEYFSDHLTIGRKTKFTFKDEIPITLSFVDTSYDVTIDALDAGGIYLGYCALDNLKDCTNIKFNGIGITYFGEECYHIDFFKDNEYEITGRHCLDSEDLKQTEIKRTDTELKITEKSIIHQYTYYSKKMGGTNFKACILMMEKNSKISIPINT